MPHLFTVLSRLQTFLISVKVARVRPRFDFSCNSRVTAKGLDIMPTQTAIIIAGVVLAFAAFAISLAWADFYTRNFRRSGSTK